MKLNEAVEEGDLDRLTNLLSQTSPEQVNLANRDTGDTALITACEKGRLDLVRLLLAHGSDDSIQNIAGGSALHAAASRDHVDIIQELYKHGADLNCINKGGLSALHVAVKKGFILSTKTLLRLGANPNNCDVTWHRTPLYEAVKLGDFRLAKLLLEKDASVNSQDATGLTPLHEAVADNNLHVARLLLKFGADINLKEDITMSSPLDQAKTSEMKQLLTIFEQRASRDSVRSRKYSSGSDSGAHSLAFSHEKLFGDRRSYHGSHDNLLQGYVFSAVSSTSLTDPAEYDVALDSFRAKHTQRKARRASSMEELSKPNKGVAAKPKRSIRRTSFFNKDAERVTESQPWTKQYPASIAGDKPDMDSVCLVTGNMRSVSTERLPKLSKKYSAKYGKLNPESTMKSKSLDNLSKIGKEWKSLPRKSRNSMSVESIRYYTEPTYTEFELSKRKYFHKCLEPWRHEVLDLNEDKFTISNITTAANKDYNARVSDPSSVLNGPYYQSEGQKQTHEELQSNTDSEYNVYDPDSSEGNVQMSCRGDVSNKNLEHKPQLQSTAFTSNDTESIDLYPDYDETSSIRTTDDAYMIDTLHSQMENPANSDNVWYDYTAEADDEMAPPLHLDTYPHEQFQQFSDQDSLIDLNLHENLVEDVAQKELQAFMIDRNNSSSSQSPDIQYEHFTGDVGRQRDFESTANVNVQNGVADNVSTDLDALYSHQILHFYTNMGNNTPSDSCKTMEIESDSCNTFSNHNVLTEGTSELNDLEKSDMTTVIPQEVLVERNDAKFVTEKYDESEQRHTFKDGEEMTFKQRHTFKYGEGVSFDKNDSTSPSNNHGTEPNVMNYNTLACLTHEMDNSFHANRFKKSDAVSGETNRYTSKKQIVLEHSTVSLTQDTSDDETHIVNQTMENSKELHKSDEPLPLKMGNESYNQQSVIIKSSEQLVADNGTGLQQSSSTLEVPHFEKRFEFRSNEQDLKVHHDLGQRPIYHSEDEAEHYYNEVERHQSGFIPGVIMDEITFEKPLLYVYGNGQRINQSYRVQNKTRNSSDDEIQSLQVTCGAGNNPAENYQAGQHYVEIDEVIVDHELEGEPDSEATLMIERNSTVLHETTGEKHVPMGLQNNNLASPTNYDVPDEVENVDTDQNVNKATFRIPHKANIILNKEIMGENMTSTPAKRFKDSYHCNDPTVVTSSSLERDSLLKDGIKFGQTGLACKTEERRSWDTESSSHDMTSFFDDSGFESMMQDDKGMQHARIELNASHMHNQNTPEGTGPLEDSIVSNDRNRTVENEPSSLTLQVNKQKIDVHGKIELIRTPAAGKTEVLNVRNGASDVRMHGPFADHRKPGQSDTRGEGQLSSDQTASSKMVNETSTEVNCDANICFDGTSKSGDQCDPKEKTNLTSQNIRSKDYGSLTQGQHKTLSHTKIKPNMTTLHDSESFTSQSLLSADLGCDQNNAAYINEAFEMNELDQSTNNKGMDHTAYTTEMSEAEILSQIRETTDIQLETLQVETETHTTEGATRKNAQQTSMWTRLCGCCWSVKYM